MLESPADTSLGEGNPYDFESDGSECAFYIERTVCTPRDKLEALLHSFEEKSASMEPEDILAALKDHTDCSTELCVMRHPATREALGQEAQEDILREFFRPEGPDKSTDWLSNKNIDDVLEQIEKKHPEFLHIFFHMRDFATYPMHQVNLKNLDFPKWMKKENKKTFGVVINTDDHTRGGTHWFALFGDFSREPFTIEYFNSTGDQPLREIQQWMLESAAEWSAELKTHVHPVVVSRRSYQSDSYSCGSYAIYYIMSRLAGTDIGFFQNDGISDAVMRKFRAYIFRK